MIIKLFILFLYYPFNINWSVIIKHSFISDTNNLCLMSFYSWLAELEVYQFKEPVFIVLILSIVFLFSISLNYALIFIILFPLFVFGLVFFLLTSPPSLYIRQKKVEAVGVGKMSLFHLKYGSGWTISLENRSLLWRMLWASLQMVTFPLPLPEKWSDCFPSCLHYENLQVFLEA